MKLNIEVQKRFDEIKKKTKEGMGRALFKVAQVFYGEVKKEAPVDHGTLQGSWQIEELDYLAYSIFTNIKYAKAVNDGTGIYGPSGQPITPKNGNVLKFKIGSQTIYTKSVKGQRPNPYIDRAIDTTESRVEKLVKQSFENVS